MRFALCMVIFLVVSLSSGVYSSVFSEIGRVVVDDNERVIETFDVSQQSRTIFCTSIADCSFAGVCNTTSGECSCRGNYVTNVNITTNGKQCNYARKTVLTGLLLGIFLSWAGADRFYMDDIAVGLIAFFLMGIGAILVSSILLCVSACICGKHSYFYVIIVIFLVLSILAGFCWWIYTIVFWSSYPPIFDNYGFEYVPL